MHEADRAQVAEWKRELWSADDGDDDDETVFVWESDAGVLGGFVSTSLRPWAEGCSGSPVPFVEGWFVAADMRRAGIGRALIAAAEEWARSLGFREIGSDVRLDNSVGLRAHRRMGFEPTERLQCFRKSLDASEVTGLVRIEMHAGSRGGLRPLFELAEDSAAQLDSYIGSGRVLVAMAGDEIVGHLQLVETDCPEEAEIKNMAVRESYQGHGIGRRLVGAAIDLISAESVGRLLVATGAAGIDNLRFYQRMGFRMHSIERDAFSAATGYPAKVFIEGIQLRDRVWLDLQVGTGDEAEPGARG